MKKYICTYNYKLKNYIFNKIGEVYKVNLLDINPITDPNYLFADSFYNKNFNLLEIEILENDKIKILNEVKNPDDLEFLIGKCEADSTGLYTKVNPRIPNQIIEYRIDDSCNKLTFYKKNNFWFKKQYKNGNAIFYEDCLGERIKCEFDENNNCVYHEDQYNFVKIFKYDKNNNLIYYKDSTGFENKNYYDSNNNCIKTVYPNRIITRTFNEQNNLIYETDNNLSYYLKYEYDKNGKIILHETKDKKIQKKYDESLNLSEELRFNKITLVETFTKYQYDLNNKLIMQVDSDKNSSAFEYDENGNQIYFQEIFNGSMYWERAEYDSRNNLVYRVDSNGHSSKYVFNEHNNLIYYKHSSGYCEKHSYNKYGTKISTQTQDDYRFQINAFGEKIESFSKIIFEKSLI